MELVVNPRGTVSTGAIMAVTIEGHPSVSYLRLATDFGRGDPLWLAKQGIPEATFHVRSRPEVVAVLTQAGIPVRDGGPLIVEVDVEYLGPALRALGFDSATAGRIKAYSDDAVQRRAQHLTVLAGLDEAGRAQEMRRIEDQWYPPTRDISA